MNLKQILPIFLVLTGFTFTVNAIEFNSGPQQSTLIELYTSEGCSSCPPAEAYLNEWKSNPRLWKDIIPLAFHVDYWDYLGWQDRFASPEHRIRQEAYAAVNHQNTIYTPAFFLNGKPWRRSLFGSEPKTDAKQTGVLSLRYDRGQITASFAPKESSASSWNLHIAILGFDLQSSIQAGENRGRDSQHEFVVLHLHSVANEKGQWRFALTRKDWLPASRYALAAWVTAEADPRPVQAVGGYLPQVN